MFTGDDLIYSIGIIFFSSFFGHQGGSGAHGNDPIILGTSIRSFRHLEHQNPSIISEDIGQAKIVQQFWSSWIRGGGVRSEKEESKEYSWLRGCDT